MNDEAKVALDKIIRKARIHFYKPIQIAEILHQERMGTNNVDTHDLSSYRNPSKRWRDIVSLRLVGRVSTSSQKFQDNLFDNNAVPPHLLAQLARVNRENGIVESYIYHCFQKRMQDVIDAHDNITQSAVDTFQLAQFLDFFERKAGLKRSVDKAFEIVVYALFSTLVDVLNAQISLTLNNPDPEIVADFAKFVQFVLGLRPDQQSVSVPASLYRSGVTNAADRGVDIVTNYGAVVQVKHLRLDAEMAENIVESVAMGNVVIVCKSAEAAIIQSLLNQVGLGIRGIITQDDLIAWYDVCQQKYPQRMGYPLLVHLESAFSQEFPIVSELNTFMAERGYNRSQLHSPYTV